LIFIYIDDGGLQMYSITESDSKLTTMDHKKRMITISQESSLGLDSSFRNSTDEEISMYSPSKKLKKSDSVKKSEQLESSKVKEQEPNKILKDRMISSSVKPIQSLKTVTTRQTKTPGSLSSFHVLSGKNSAKHEKSYP
jgi:hypothetical protein